MLYIIYMFNNSFGLIMLIIFILIIINILNTNNVEYYDATNVDNFKKKINELQTTKPPDQIKYDVPISDNDNVKPNNPTNIDTFYKFNDNDEINYDNFKGALTSSDLLPDNSCKTDYNEFMIEAEYNNSNLLLNGSIKLGEDTIGSTKKNASYDLRGTLPCPKFIVSPWCNSTYEPDTNIKSLC